MERAAFAAPAADGTDSHKSSRDTLRARNDQLERINDELSDSLAGLRAEIAARQKIEAKRETILQAMAAAQEAERGRISRELHDGVGQHVTTLLLGLKGLERDLTANPAALEVVQSLHAIAENIGQEIHAVAVELRPTALDDLGLVRALSSYLEDWSARMRIPVQFDHADLGSARLPPLFETTLYRLISEALHNVVKHAQATAVSVILQRKKGCVTAIIEDNGMGFDATAQPPLDQRGRLGLVGMGERLSFVNGELTIESEIGRGTTVIARLPISSHDAPR